jgi:hypothetical protein
MAAEIGGYCLAEINNLRERKQLLPLLAVVAGNFADFLGRTGISLR